MLRWILLILSLWLGLSACQTTPRPESEAELPTVAALPTLTQTLTATGTPSLTATDTPTQTQTASITPTVTLTVTPSTTITDTPTPTFTASPSITPNQGALFCWLNLRPMPPSCPKPCNHPCPPNPMAAAM